MKTFWRIFANVESRYQLQFHPDVLLAVNSQEDDPTFLKYRLYRNFVLTFGPGFDGELKQHLRVRKGALTEMLNVFVKTYADERHISPVEFLSWVKQNHS